MKNGKRILALAACLAVAAGAAGTLAGCGGDGAPAPADTGANTEGKTLTFGTTEYTYYDGVNPHYSYSGWYTVRYGIGETLVKISETGGLEPWLAKSYKNTDEKTWVITLRDDVTFQNGKKVDAAAVKDCLQRLIENHDRAPGDLQIDSMAAKGQTLTVKTKKANPAFMNYLADPYSAIIDVSEGVNGSDHVVGTGPYVLEKATDETVVVHANKDYWNGTPKVDTVNVIAIKDGDTLDMALKRGEVDVAQGMPSSSYAAFRADDQFVTRSVDTSRTYDLIYNQTKPALQDVNVRKAIACAIDKEGFTTTLFNGEATPAVGFFPATYTFGDSALTTESYDIAKAKSLLEKAGWKDTDGDGYVDKDGQNLELTWLTYASRQELPLLAENAESTLKQAGIKVNINVTDNYADSITSNGFDIFAVSIVSAPTGDPEYIFGSFFNEGGPYCVTGWKDAEFEKTLQTLRTEFDEKKRSDLAVQLQQRLLDQNVLTFVCHQRLSLVMNKGVTGLEPHTSDYYELTADLDITK